MNRLKDRLELRYSVLSPYARKVRIVAHEAGIADDVELVLTNTHAEPDGLAPLNPLGKIPVLTINGTVSLFDSPVICEYLDTTYGSHRLLPDSGARRWSIMTDAAIADGVIDSAVLVRQERAKPQERQTGDWIAWQMRKILQGLDRFEARVASFGEDLDMSHVGLASALGYIPLRLEEFATLERWPNLKAWYGRISAKPSIRLTSPEI